MNNARKAIGPANDCSVVTSRVQVELPHMLPWIGLTGCRDLESEVERRSSADIAADFFAASSCELFSRPAAIVATNDNLRFDPIALAEERDLNCSSRSPLPRTDAVAR